MAIVGSGPSALYTAKYLLKRVPTARVDVFEREPVPFGLVRFGVAPDHQEVKLVTNEFDKLFEDTSRVRFHGNVAIGKDMSVAELQAMYGAVVLAAGAGTHTVYVNITLCM